MCVCVAYWVVYVFLSAIAWWFSCLRRLSRKAEARVQAYKINFDSGTRVAAHVIRDWPGLHQSRRLYN